MCTSKPYKSKRTGNCYTYAFLDLETGRVRQAASSQIIGCHGCRSAWSTMIVRGGLLAALWNPWEREGILKRAKEVLAKFSDVRQFNYLHPEDAERLPVEQRYRTRFLSGDSIANFLWSVRLIQYMEGKGTP